MVFEWYLNVFKWFRTHGFVWERFHCFKTWRTLKKCDLMWKLGVFQKKSYWNWVKATKKWIFHISQNDLWSWSGRNTTYGSIQKFFKKEVVEVIKNTHQKYYNTICINEKVRFDVRVCSFFVVAWKSKNMASICFTGQSLRVELTKVRFCHSQALE